ncbi:MAG TPA: hypothetical protein VNF75_09375 [Candidatus Dormibacteraeota bacterium]|nr:hypothetical protein [Candidatus Dormibacteraeota bacterium]
MTVAALLAAGGFLGSAIALLSVGARGMVISALALGLGMGGVASLSGGVAAFFAVAGVGAAAAVLIAAGRFAPGLASGRWLLGRSPVVGRERVFDVRSLRLLVGIGGLMAARLLAGHLGAGTVSTQGPAFACLFAWEVGIIRVATGRGPSDLALGGLCVAMGTSTFLILSAPHSVLVIAVLTMAVPAIGLVLLTHAAPWETGS